MRIRNCFPIISSIILSYGFSETPAEYAQTHTFKPFKCEVRHSFNEVFPDGQWPGAMFTEAPIYSTAQGWDQTIGDGKGKSQFSDMRFEAYGSVFNKIFNFYLKDAQGKVIQGHPIELALPQGNSLDTSIQFRLDLDTQQRNNAVYAFVRSQDPHNGILGYLNSQDAWSALLSGVNIAGADLTKINELAKKFVYMNSVVVCGPKTTN